MFTQPTDTKEVPKPETKDETFVPHFSVSKPELKVEPKEKVEDRSEYNCSGCGGDGIVEGAGRLKLGEICLQCAGTGKI